MLLFDGNRPTTQGDETLAGDLVDKLGATRAAIKLLQGEEHALEDWLVHVAAPADTTPRESYIASGEEYSAEITRAPGPQRRRTDRPRITLAPEPSGGLDYLMRRHADDPAPRTRLSRFAGVFALGLIFGCLTYSAVIAPLSAQVHPILTSATRPAPLHVPRSQGARPSTETPPHT